MIVRLLVIAAIAGAAAAGFAAGGGFKRPLTPEYANWQHEVCSTPPGGGPSDCYPTPPPESGWELRRDQTLNPRLSVTQLKDYRQLLVRLHRIEWAGLDRILGKVSRSDSIPR